MNILENLSNYPEHADKLINGAMEIFATLEAEARADERKKILDAFQDLINQANQRSEASLAIDPIQLLVNTFRQVK